jgi:5-methylcytosine-specific restriction endonuclease McrA
MKVASALAATVRNRDRDRCEYCKMHQSLQGATFQIEHIIPRSLGGATNLDNLVLACPSCNLHKSNATKGIDPETGQFVPLFHPVHQTWTEHFRLTIIE